MKFFIVEEKKAKPMKAVFITGTDTGVGKTVVCGLLARYLLDRGCNAITQKWIQTGSKAFPPDITTHLKLMAKTRGDIKKHLPNIIPYNFAMPASPHLAAATENKRISASKISCCFQKLSDAYDFVIVEGIGGAMVPFNRKKLVIDIAADLNLPVIIVAQNKLGAINHTLLTIEAIREKGLPILGIIFNGNSGKENKFVQKDNPKIVKALTGETILGNLPWLKNKDLLHKAFEPIGKKLCTLIKKENW